MSEGTTDSLKYKVTVYPEILRHPDPDLEPVYTWKWIVENSELYHGYVGGQAPTKQQAWERAKHKIEQLKWMENETEVREL